MCDESFFVFTLQSKDTLYLNLQEAIFRPAGDPLRFSYPADHPLAPEFEDQMTKLLRSTRATENTSPSTTPTSPAQRTTPGTAQHWRYSRR